MADIKFPKNPDPSEGQTFCDLGLYVLALGYCRGAGGALDWGEPVSYEFRDFRSPEGATFVFTLPDKQSED